MTAALLRLVVVIIIAALGSSAQADNRSRADFFASTLFVASRDSDRLTLIDADLLEVKGLLPVGLAPRYMAVADRLGLIVVGDGGSRIHLADAATGDIHRLAFDFAPSRALLAPAGTQLAAIDPAAGTIAFVDIATQKETGRIAGLGRLRDELFSVDGQTLYVAVEGQADLLAIDARRGERRPGAAGGPYSALARSPNGRAAFATPAGSGAVEMVDLTGKQSPARVAVGAGVKDVYVTGTGRFVLAPDNRTQRVLVASTEPFQIAASLQGAPGMTAAYSTWFDLYAFVSSAGRRQLLVYDLEQLTALGEIELHGQPGHGTVSPDGAKLFLPIEEAGVIDVVDARYRRVARSIPVGAPIGAAMAGGYGICH